MSRVGLMCLGLADGSPGPQGCWLSAYDPESGVSDWTPDPLGALTFATMAEAFEFYRQVHPTQPVRPWDGRPNRPLTAFTVECGPIPEPA